MAGKGRPKWEPSKQERDWVTVAVAGGTPYEAIAHKLGVHPQTLRKVCRKELDNGLVNCVVQVSANFLRIATGDSKAAAWAADRWLRMRAPEQWRDQPTQIANAPGEALAIHVITGVPRATDDDETDKG